MGTGFRRCDDIYLGTIWPGLRIAFLRGPQNVHIELLDRNTA